MLGQLKIVFSEFRGDVNKPWKLKKRNAGKELRRDCTDSSGRVGLCAPSLPSRVGTSLLRAKQGAAPAMGLIPLVCKGGGQNGDGAQYTTPWSIQRQQQGRATAAVAKPDSGAALGGTRVSEDQSKISVGVSCNFENILPMFFPPSRSFGRLLENKWYISPVTYITKPSKGVFVE